MAGIFTRKAITALLNNADLTPEERADQLYALYGQALADGYVTKAAAEAAKNEAVETAKKEFKPQEINVKETDDYKALVGEFDAYKARETARHSDDFKGVKGKFFDTVYDRIDRTDKAKPISEQLADMRKEYEEYFDPQDNGNANGGKPTFSGGTHGGGMPTGSKAPSFSDAWGFVPKNIK